MTDDHSTRLRDALNAPGGGGAFPSQRLIRHANERRVLTILRQQKALTRAEIARRLGLTRSTVTSLVDGLIGRDLLMERPEDVRAEEAGLGRPGVKVALNPAGGFFAGVEIGLGVLRCVLIDLALAPVEQQVELLALPMSVANVVERIGAFLDGRTAYAGRICGLGLTVPGLVGRDGLVLHLPMIGWRDVDLRVALRARVDLPLVIENNANAAAFCELYAGPAAPAALMLFLKLGAGCGGAAILRGQLLQGVGGSATEFGHVRVADDGPVCSCGQTGCLEPYVSIAALRRLAPADVPDMAFPAHLAGLVERGDPAALYALDRLIHYLARGLVTLTHVFNPSRIVLGGVSRPLLALALDRLREALVAGIIPGMAAPALCLSHLGAFECALGAAMIIHQKASDVLDFDVVSLMQK